ncbi:VWA domain-containing protein [bacterium]|nr:VWA domain-containing protein [bacterium]
MRRILLTVVFSLLALSVTYAQPNLNFKRVTVNWPTIELYFSVGCNGNPAYNMAKQDFKIFENDIEVKDFTLWCPDPSVRCGMSVALVFDASGSMSGAGNAGAKAAGRAFVDGMDGMIDEATVIWFNTQVNIAQQMTTLKPLLYSAVDGIPAGGGTAVWDGCYAGIIELINNGVNQCRAVIVMTDGGDNSSTRTPAEIISLANRNRIPVFTIGLGTSINATELEMIALLTGGRYYQTPNAGQLAAIYLEIMTIIQQGMQECVITYERDCADGGYRSVELQLKDFCGGTDVETKTYRAPMDSTTFSDLYMELGDTYAKGGADVDVPLELITPIDDRMFYPFRFTVLFDESKLQFKAAEAPVGYLLHGVPFTVSPAAGGVYIQTAARIPVSGNGLLLNLTFGTVMVQDTTCTQVSFYQPNFEQGCFIPKVASGEVCIVPAVPEVACTMDGPSQLAWEELITDYVPNPFTVTGRFFNTGEADALNARFKIAYDTTVLRLVSPLMDEQSASPPNIAPGNYAEVSWQVAARPIPTGDSTMICITGMMDNHKSIDCCVQVYVPPATTSFECSLDIPEIEIRPDQKGYTPMPFTVRAGIKNNGAAQTGSMIASILLPDGFTLTGSASERQLTRQLNPGSLAPDEEAFIEWYLEHDPVALGKTANIQVEFTENGAFACIAGGDVTLPALDIPFTVQLTHDDDLLLCEGETVTLNAPEGYASYKWSTGYEQRSLTVSTTGDYWCTVKTPSGQSGQSDTVHVEVYPIPHPQLQPGGTQTLCDGDTLILDAGAGFTYYNWNNGATGQKALIMRSGAYFVTVGNAAGCEGRSDTVFVQILPAPDKPRINRTGDVLMTDLGPMYQWMLNGQNIPGATNQYHVAVATGTYRVRITNEHGCSSLSDPLTISVLGVDDTRMPGDPVMHVYPDPADDRVTLSLEMPAGMTGSVFLVDILGKTELLRDAVGSGQRIKTTLDLSGRAKGMYHIMLRTPDGVYTKKFLKK